MRREPGDAKCCSVSVQLCCLTAAFSWFLCVVVRCGEVCALYMPRNKQNVQIHTMLWHYFSIVCDTGLHPTFLSLPDTHTETHTHTQNSIYSLLPGDKILLLLSPFSWTNLLCFALTFMSGKRSMCSRWCSSLTMWHVTSLLAGHVTSQRRLSSRRAAPDRLVSM